MKKSLLVVLFVLAFAGVMMGQAWTSPVDVLGAHNNNGRGCAGCHAPHSGSFGSGHAGAADAGSYALWGQDASPLYNKTIAFGDGGRYTEVMPSTITGGSQEVGGILLCLSCHDGNVTASNMMVNQSYEQRIGLLTNTSYGTGEIPTLLGNDGTTAGNYNNDHPVGQLATISTGSGLGLPPPGNAVCDRRQPLCSVRSQLRLARSGSWQMVESLRRYCRRQALCALHHLPQPARDDGLYVFSGKPDRGRWRRQILCHLLLHQRPV